VAFGLVQLIDAPTQKAALRKLASLAQNGMLHPVVRETAFLIIGECDARDDECELEAIFNAVKHGDPRVAALKKGFKYIADPRSTDYFTAPHRALQACLRGACGGDCDDHTALICALAGAIGFKVGLRAWGEYGEDFSHVYAVALLSKRNPTKVVGLDTTVAESYVGWEPPKGRVMTALLE